MSDIMMTLGPYETRGSNNSDSGSSSQAGGTSAAANLKNAYFQFSIDTAAYQELRRNVEYRWAELNRIAHRPSLQFVGVGKDEIELRGVILPTFKGGIHQMDILRYFAQKGRPQLLTTGRGENWGPWCVLAITDEQRQMTFKGTPLRIEFTLRLSYYGPDDESTGSKGYVSSTWYNLLGKQGATTITPPDLPANLPSNLPPVSTSQLSSISPALTAAKIPPQVAASTLTKAIQQARLIQNDAVAATAVLATVSMTVSSLKNGIAHDPVGTMSRLLTSGIGQTGIKTLFGADMAGSLSQIGAAVQIGQVQSQTVGNLLATAGRSVS
jgi:phage protein U